MIQKSGRGSGAQNPLRQRHDAACGSLLCAITAVCRKKLEVNPIHAETVRLIYRLVLRDEGDSGPMGFKAVTKHLNERNTCTRDGGRWGIAAVHQILSRNTYIGEHRFNTSDHRTKDPKPERNGGYRRDYLRSVAQHTNGGRRTCPL